MNLRRTGFEVNTLILRAVESGTGMDKDCWRMLWLAEAQHLTKGTISSVWRVGHHRVELCMAVAR